MNMAAVKERIDLWRQHMPNVVPHYEVMANNGEHLLKCILEQGCNFDCASRAEIELVLRLGGHSNQIIFANPCKLEDHIAYARDVGV